MSNPKIEAVLLDLDDTLLGNDVDQFLQGYFTRLGRYAAQVMPPDKFHEALMASTEATIRSTDTAVTNNDVFWINFERLTGLNPAEMEPFFRRFYEEQFPLLVDATYPRAAAAPLVQTCLDAGVAVVVATNPLFPQIAIEQRLEWAGVPVTSYPFALVTTLENMHAAKPNPAYYLEIARRLDVAPETAVMVGDDWENDIVPAHAVGMRTFWIEDGTPPQDPGLLAGAGALDDFYEMVASGWLENPAASPSV